MTADRTPSSVRSVAFLRRRSEGSPIGAKSTQIEMTKSRPNAGLIRAKTHQNTTNRTKAHHSQPKRAKPYQKSSQKKIKLQSNRATRHQTGQIHNVPKWSYNKPKLTETEPKRTNMTRTPQNAIETGQNSARHGQN